MLQTFRKTTWQYLVHSLKESHIFGLGIPLQGIHPEDIIRVAVCHLCVRCVALFLIEGKVEINLIAGNKRKVKQTVTSEK